jgi:hypothetical protein
VFADRDAAGAEIAEVRSQIAEVKALGFGCMITINGFTSAI